MLAMEGCLNHQLSSSKEHRYFIWDFHLTFSSRVVPWILAMAKLVISLLSLCSVPQHPLVLWGHYSLLQKWLQNASQMHLCFFSTFKTRGGFFPFSCPFLFLSLKLCSEVMIPQKVLSLQLSVPPEIKVWVKQNLRRTGSSRQAQLSVI